jgi:acetoin utilization protein AcuB
MNTQDPLSKIMSTKLVTVNASDKLTRVHDIFKTHKIHHIPVVDFKSIVGILSKSDFQFFQRGYLLSENDNEKFEDMRNKSHEVKELMTTGIAKLSSTDKIATAIEVFKENLFHCIPIVDDDELVGIVTPLDIIKNV